MVPKPVFGAPAGTDVVGVGVGAVVVVWANVIVAAIRNARAAKMDTVVFCAKVISYSHLQSLVIASKV